MTQELTGHCVIGNGGTGIMGVRNASPRWNALPRKPIVTCLAFDTDEASSEVAEEFGAKLCNIAVRFDEIETFVAEQEKLTPVAAKIWLEHRNSLNSESLGAGSGTRRWLTEFFMEVNRAKVIEELVKAVVRLRERGVSRIQFHLAGSDSGGAGSAFTILLNYLLSDPAVRAQLLSGCEGMELVPPIVYLADVSCHVRSNTYPEREKIQSNKLYTSFYVGNLLRDLAANNERLVSFFVLTGAGSRSKFLATIDDVEAELGGVLAMHVIFWERIRKVGADRIAHYASGVYTGANGLTAD